MLGLLKIVIAPTRFTFVLLVFTAFLLGHQSAQAARAFIVIDSKTGHILQEDNSRKKLQVGSLTKVAMAMVVLDWAEKQGGDLAQVATIPPEALVGTGENLIGLQPGDTVTLRDLLYAALVQSDGVSSYTLAAYVGERLQSLVPSAGSPVTTFVSQMNALAKSLQMERTRFSNPDGQDANARPMPYSTAADMARLSRYAMSKAAFRFYVSQKERQISFKSGEKQRDYKLRNTNELLGQDGVEGVKTGRTARAGDCLILSAQREAEVIQRGPSSATITPRHIIIVLLGSSDRFGEGRGLLTQGWQLYDQWAAAGRVVEPKKAL